jgi:HK97 family phage major capsid protein
MDRIPLYLAAFCAALMHTPSKTTTPTNIYRVASWDLGFSSVVKSWRRTLSVGAQRVVSACRGLWVDHRQLVTASAVLLLCLVLAPDHLHAHAGVGAMLVAGHLNIDAMERDLLAKSGEAAALFEKTAKECQAYQEKDKDGKVTVQGRLFTDEEKKAVQVLLDEGLALKSKIASAKGDANLQAEIAKLTAGMTVETPKPGQPGRVVQSLGQQWAASPAGQFFFKKMHQGSRNWNSPVAELFDMRAATLTSDAASGGDLIVSDFRPGILPLLFKRLTVRDLLAPGRTDSNSISYMKETTFTNAAATVAEGTDKPQSTLIFDLVNDLVQKIAHWLPVTEEMLEDVSQIRSYIDARLRLGVDLTEEDQLLNGDGTPPNIRGILNRVGLTAAQARGADTNADAIFKEMMKVFNASFVMPDGHVINPANWQTTQLSKDANGQYYGSGPFAGPQAPTLWGLPVAVSPSIVANTALTGAFRSSAQIFDHGNLRVEASNSHSDFFIKNLVAIRAEERLALAVYRPAAFGTTTGLN